MSVQIRVSYMTDGELSRVIRLLSPALESYKIARNHKGQYKKAYIYLKQDKSRDQP